MITRQVINSAMVFQYHDKLAHIKTYSYEDFCDRIDRWKMFYVEQYNAQPGQTVLVDFTKMTIDYFASIFAAAELGLILITGVPNEWRKQNGKDTDVIPTVAVQVDYILDFDTKSDWDHKLYAALGKNVIPNAYWQDYQVKNKDQLRTIKDLIHCRDDSVLTLNLATQSTATHKEIVAVSRRLSDILGYNDQASAVHTKNMHLLSSNFCWSFLPAFMVCREHFVFNDSDVPGSNDYFYILGEFVLENNINFVSIDHIVPKSLVTFLKDIGSVQFDLHINTTDAINREAVNQLKIKNIKSINGIFGSNGLFVKKVDANTPAHQLQMNNFGAPVDDFYQFQIDNNQLYYSCPSLNKDWQTDNDLFIVKNGEYHYAGRAQ